MFTEIYDEGYKPNTSSDIWGICCNYIWCITGDAPFGNDGGVAQLYEVKIFPNE